MDIGIIRNFVKFAIKAQAWPEHSFKLPKLQTHRGYWKSGLQENTLASLVKAKELGSKMCEFDVLLSCDGVPVLFHDDNLNRLAKRNEISRQCTSHQLQEWANATLLEEVLTNPAVPTFLNIELKSIGADDPLERKVSELILKHNVQNRILFSSFNPFSIWKLSQFLPEVPRALLVCEDIEPGNNIFLRTMAMAPLLSIHLLHLDKKMISRESMQFWKSKNMPIAAWTVNDLKEMRQLEQMGVASIITDLAGPDLDITE